MTSVLQFLIALTLILVAAKLGGLISTRLQQPAVLGELLAGIILGPTVFNAIHAFPDEALMEELIHHLAELGVIVLMFLAGLETELEDLNRTRLTAILAGSFGVVVPILFALAVAPVFGYGVEPSIFLGLVLAATSVSITARTLMELGVLQSREGVSILGAAVADDVLALLSLSVFVAVVTGGGGDASISTIPLIVGKMVLYFAIAIAFGYFLLPRLTRWAAGLPVSENLSSFSLVMMLIFAFLAETLGGVAMITGAFVVGLLFTRTEFGHLIEERVRILAYAFLVPIFFINIGLSANLRAFEAQDILLIVVLSATAVVSKILGCGGGARLSGLPWLESLRIGVGMVSRGEVGLIVAAIGVSSGIIDEKTFSLFVVVVIISTLITPLLLKLVFVGRTQEAVNG